MASSSSSAAALKKLPPNVLRELRRHINPVTKGASSSSSSSKTAAQSTTGTDSKRMKYLFYGCVGFTSITASIPLVAHYYMSGLNEKEEPLTAAQVRRGAFLNSGSKDIGKDPNWDFEHGVYKKATGYSTIAANDATGRPKSGEFYAIPSSELENQEEKLRAFAEGRRRQDGRDIIKK